MPPHWLLAPVYRDVKAVRGEPFGFAQDRPFGFAQDRPFGFAQDKPAGPRTALQQGFGVSLRRELSRTLRANSTKIVGERLRASVVYGGE
jgi:hypothetical protein